MYEPTDEELCTRIRRANEEQKRDSRAEDALVARWRPLLLRYLKWKFPDRRLDHEQVVNDSLCDLVAFALKKKILDLRKVAPIIAVRVGWKAFRQEAPSHDPIDTVEVEDRAPGPEEQAIFADAMRALGRLSDYERNVFLLYCMEGYSQREIGEMCGKEEKNIKATLHRAREKLKAFLLDRDSEAQR